MAELIWRAADPNAAGHVATYDSGGARVEVHKALSAAAGGTSPRGGGKAPAWVRAGQEIMSRRIREYMEETGRLPSQELIADFQEEMGKRLNAYIEEPMKHPFRPMGLREFELRVES